MEGKNKKKYKKLTCFFSEKTGLGFRGLQYVRLKMLIL